MHAIYSKTMLLLHATKPIHFISKLINMPWRESWRPARHPQPPPTWQSYVDNRMMIKPEGNRLTSAAIFGIRKSSLWAKSSGFPPVTYGELAALLNAFNEPGSPAPTALHLGGTEYPVIYCEPGAVIRCEKEGNFGVTIKKTKEALLVGLYDENMDPKHCKMLIEHLGDYLIDQGC